MMKPKKDAFAKVPLWWMQAATAPTRTPKALVCVELLHTSWEGVAVSNAGGRCPLPGE